MSTSDKRNQPPQSSHRNCRYISSHTSLEDQVGCLAMKVSKLSVTRGKTMHPCRLTEDTKTLKLRPKKLNNKPCLVSGMSAVTITDARETKVYRNMKQRPASTVDIKSTRLTALNNERNIDQLTTGKNYKQLTINNELCVTSETQLLHPDWRKIPWILYFGWTKAHGDLCKQLQCLVGRGSLESIYYKSAKEHCSAGMTWRYHHGDSEFLGGPAVNTVSEALELMRTVHSRQIIITRHQLSDAAAPGYDGDDEDVV